jgi:hypothetical protein
VFRVTFSKSLAEYLAAETGLAVGRVSFRLGRVLAPGERSSTGLYAVVKAATGWTLRVTQFPELADRWRHETRYVAECLPV